MHENHLEMVSGSFNYRKVPEFGLGPGKGPKQHGTTFSSHSRAVRSAQRRPAKGEMGPAV